MHHASMLDAMAVKDACSLVRRDIPCRACVMAKRSNSLRHRGPGRGSPKAIFSFKLPIVASFSAQTVYKHIAHCLSRKRCNVHNLEEELILRLPTPGFQCFNEPVLFANIQAMQGVSPIGKVFHSLPKSNIDIYLTVAANVASFLT